jgi:hypothetical protein
LYSFSFYKSSWSFYLATTLILCQELYSILYFSTSVTTGNVPVVDGLLADRQSRRYSMQNCRRRARAPCQRGEPLREKVKLDNVVAAKTKEGCKHNCLRDVDEKYILDQRYMAWG